METSSSEEFSFKIQIEISPSYYDDLLLFIYHRYIVPYYHKFANVRRWITDGRETLAFSVLGPNNLWHVDVEITSGNPLEIQMKPSNYLVPPQALRRIKEDLMIIIQMFEDEVRRSTLYFAWVPEKNIVGEKAFTRRKRILNQIFTGNMLLLFVIFISFSYFIFAMAFLFGVMEYAPLLLLLSQVILVLFSDKIMMQMSDWSITESSPNIYILQYHIPPEEFDYISQNYPRERLLQIKKDIYEKTLALGRQIDVDTVQEVFSRHGITIKPENLLIKSINVYNIVKEVARKFNMPIPKIRIVNTIVPNAAATGPSPRFSLILITTGLLIQLDEKEIFAVIGHEVSHVKGRDPLMLFLLSSAEYLVRVYLLFRYIMFLGFFYIFFALGIIYFIAKFFEARADLEAALVLGEPEYLANALRKIGYRRLWFERITGRGNSWFGFDPHPPLSFRIDRLEKLDPSRIKHPFLQSVKDCLNGLFREIRI